MTDLKFELLGILYPANSTDPVRKLQLLQSGLASPVEVEKALVDLGRQGYVTSAVGSDIVTLTTAGRTAFEGAQISRKKQTDDKKQQRFQNKISVASVLVPLVTFFLGLVVEYQAGIVAWTVALFS